MNSISVKNLVVSFKPLKRTSVKALFSRKNKKEKAILAVNDISFDVEKGEVVGLIGKNGSGKSTLLRAIAGVYSPDSGTIEVGSQSKSLLTLGAGFMDEITGRKNIYITGLLLGFSKEEIKKHEQEIIDFADIGDFIDKPVKTYSSGMHSKLSFAITAILETNIMLVDEILSVGDEQFQVKSFNKMRDLILDKNKTVVIVSHNIIKLLELCDRVIWMHEGKIVKIGKPETIIDEYKEFMTNNG